MDFISSILKKYPKKTFRKGEYLIYQGQPLHHLLLLLEGEVQRKQTTETGEDVVYDIRKEKNNIDALIGVLILFGKNQIATTSFVAKTNCSVCVIPDVDFFRYVVNNPSFLVDLLSYSVARYDYLDAQYRMRLEKKTSNKLCAMLLQYSERNRIVLPMNFSEIARHYGVHRVTIAKIMKQLELLKVIRRENGYIEILDIKELEAYAEGKKMSYNNF